MSILPPISFKVIKLVNVNAKKPINYDDDINIKASQLKKYLDD
jgi:hypothetical protein